MKTVKFCKRCDTPKPLLDFSKDKCKRDGKRTICKKCDIIYSKKNNYKYKESKKQYYINNKEKFAEIRQTPHAVATKKQYYINNKEKFTETRQTPHAVAAKKQYDKEYQKVRNFRYANDAEYKIVTLLRGRLGLAIRAQRTSKTADTMSLVGCTIDELWDHLKKQFKPWMTVENHGLWEIDHIIPCIKFKLLCPLQQVLCFHFTNLQPLKKEENRSKGSEYTLN